MGLIEVDPDSLAVVGDQLLAGVGVAHGVQKHHSAMASHAGHSGHPDAARGIADFLQRWSYGCGHMTGDANAIAQALRAAGVRYHGVEDDIGSAADPNA